MLGVPEDQAQQVRHWIDDGLHREVGQVEVGEKGMQANIDNAMFYLNWCRSGERSRKTTFSPS